MPTSYQDALAIISSVASGHKTTFSRDVQTIPISTSYGRNAALPVTSPRRTPPFDTSAMDGFAVSSTATASASEESPVILEVRAVIAAGDSPVALSNAPDNGVVPCAEITTGAQFPISVLGEDFDACVPIEHTTEIMAEKIEFPRRRITKPVRHMQHRRLGGSDFQEGETILEPGQTIQHSHIMAMASQCISEVAVARPARVGIFSTGSELMPHDSSSMDADKIVDCNGPYLTATLNAIGVDARFVGVLPDRPDRISTLIRESCHGKEFDVLITTGAVSVGRFDYVRAAIENIGASIQFHKLAIRPGHPVLFATVDEHAQKEKGVQLNGSRDTGAGLTAFFGLPGNPIAAAACLRFLVIPYLGLLRGLKPEIPLIARVVSPKSQCNGTSGGCQSGLNREKLRKLDLFRLGYLRATDSGWEVEVGTDQSPGKVKPLVEANCWIHQHEGRGELYAGQMVDCFRIC